MGRRIVAGFCGRRVGWACIFRRLIPCVEMASGGGELVVCLGGNDIWMVYGSHGMAWVSNLGRGSFVGVALVSVSGTEYSILHVCLHACMLPWSCHGELACMGA